MKRAIRYRRMKRRDTYPYERHPARWRGNLLRWQRKGACAYDNAKIVKEEVRRMLLVGILPRWISEHIDETWGVNKTKARFVGGNKDDAV